MGVKGVDWTDRCYNQVRRDVFVAVINSHIPIIDNDNVVSLYPQGGEVKMAA